MTASALRVFAASLRERATTARRNADTYEASLYRGEAAFQYERARAFDDAAKLADEEADRIDAAPLFHCDPSCAPWERTVEGQILRTTAGIVGIAIPRSPGASAGSATAAVLSEEELERRVWRPAPGERPK